MKFLIIILLIASCGKHQQPKDEKKYGSQSSENINYAKVSFQENPLIKEQIAPYNLSGSLTFFKGRGIKEVYSFKLTNEMDKVRLANRLLTQNSKFSTGLKYISPYSILSLESTPNIELQDDAYDVVVDLNATPDWFHSLVYIEEKIVVHLDRFLPGQTIRLEKKQLDALLKGKAQLALERSQETRPASNQTYTLFFHNGLSGKILDISNEFSIEKFIQFYSLKDVKSFSADAIFYKSLEDSKHWWIQSFEGYKVIVYASEKELYDAYLENFEKRSFTLTRSNGVSPSVEFNKPAGAKVVLRISGKKTINLFTKRTQDFIKTVRSDGNMTTKTPCTHFYLDAHESSGEFSLQEVQNDLLLSTYNVSINHQAKLKFHLNSIEVKLDNRDQQITFSLPNLPSSTYQQVGLYHNTCDKKNRTHPINQEKELILKVEALVEKI